MSSESGVKPSVKGGPDLHQGIVGTLRVKKPTCLQVSLRQAMGLCALEHFIIYILNTQLWFRIAQNCMVRIASGQAWGNKDPELSTQEICDAHRKNPGTCSIKGDTVHSREMSQDPPVHPHVLIIADRVDSAEALSSCELSASTHLHCNDRQEIHSFHFSVCQDGTENALNRDQGWL